MKHCILGILKDRTRIIVTENRTLFYYSNQILRVENGVVTTSDFALGSFESEYTDEEIDFESNSGYNFELDDEHKSAEQNAFSQVRLISFIPLKLIVFNLFFFYRK